jgi:hypothetical protein
MKWRKKAKRIGSVWKFVVLCQVGLYQINTSAYKLVQFESVFDCITVHFDGTDNQKTDRKVTSNCCNVSGERARNPFRETQAFALIYNLSQKENLTLLSQFNALG